MTMLKKLLKQRLMILTLVVVLVVGLVYMRKTERFEDKIDKDAKKYDDALEKRIAEVKAEHPRFDAELLLVVNRPYEQGVNDEKGWYSEAINGSVIPTIYTKPKNTWIFPY